MSDENRELLQRAYDAFGRGDIPGVLETFDDDIEWNAPKVLPHGMSVRGREAVGGFFQTIADVWGTSLALQLDSIVAEGDRAFATGTASGSIDGVRGTYRWVHAWTIAGGRCIRFDEYVDPSPEVIAASSRVRAGAGA